VSVSLQHIVKSHIDVHYDSCLCHADIRCFFFFSVLILATSKSNLIISQIYFVDSKKNVYFSYKS